MSPSVEVTGPRRYTHVSMLVYSGTGNALTAARWIGDQADSSGTRSEITLLDHQTPPPRPAGGDRRVLQGFLYSTHGFCVPWTMLKRLVRFPRRRGADVDIFLLNTRGGLKVGPLLLPGLTGVALLLPVLLMGLKGYRVVGSRPLDMPSSWHQVHPALRDSSVEVMLARRRQQVDTFARTLLAGGRAHHGWWMLPIDLSLLPITVLYLTVGRFGLAKLQVASADCDGCQLCRKTCPVDAIEMRHGRPFWTIRCESCMRCYSICPRRSVQTCHLYAAAMIAPCFGLVDWIHAQVWPHVLSLPGLLVVPGALVYLLAWIGVTLAFMVGCYAVLAQLMRVPWLNRSINLVSMTRFFRRYLAPGVKGRDLRPKERGTGE